MTSWPSTPGTRYLIHPNSLVVAAYIFTVLGLIVSDQLYKKLDVRAPFFQSYRFYISDCIIGDWLSF